MKVQITLLKESVTEQGTLGKLKVLIYDSVMKVSGSILVSSPVATKMYDQISRHPKGLFDLEFHSGKERIKVQNCTGDRVERFFLGGVKMANVYFEQTCVRAPNLQQNFDVEKVEEIHEPREFVSCPTFKPDNPELGDMYYDEEKKCLCMYMSYGWNEMKSIPVPPGIEQQKRLVIPDHAAIFFCTPIEPRRWDRNIDHRRARKILQIKRRRH